MKRLLSIDVFRGLTMAAMVLVENPGDWYYAYSPLRHAPWGRPITVTDWILPFFIFAMGLSIPIAMDRRRAAGASDGASVRRIVRRSLILFGLGVLFYLYPRFDFAGMRIPGVLQSLAVIYLITALLHLRTGWKFQALLVPFILAGNWILLTRVPIPGIGRPGLHPDVNLAAWLDSALLGGHLRNPGSDPEGIITTLSATAVCLLGGLAGRWLLSRRSPLVKAGGLAAIGIPLIGLAKLWAGSFPMIKDIWTGTYSLYTGGLALCILALCVGLADRPGRKGWTRPLAAYGASPIAVYLASEITYVTLSAVIRIPTPGGTLSLLEIINRGIFRPWLDPAAASFAFALGTVLFWGIPLWILYKKKIFIRI